jgi:hypothetical protein
MSKTDSQHRDEEEKCESYEKHFNKQYSLFEKVLFYNYQISTTVKIFSENVDFE